MTKITVDKVEGDINYDDVMKEFGIESIEPFLSKMKELPLLYRRGVVFGQRDFKQIYEAMRDRKRFAVLTGINPSSPLHLGHLLFLNQAKFFQRCGADVFIPISNDETYVFRKKETLEEATKNALENAIPDIIALGFDPKKTKIFISTQYRKVYELAVKLSTKTTFSTIKALFGFTNETNPGQIFYSIVQSAHILLPQTEEFGGPKPVVVPIGIDQDPYMRLVRDIAERAGFMKPSSTYHKFFPGLQGGKMSSSDKNSCIFLSDKPEDVEKKIMRAFSGGAPSLEEHRRKGGNPDVDIACQYLYFFFEEDDKKALKIIDNYRSGALSSGDVKQMLAEKVRTFLVEHQRKKEKVLKDVDKFLMR
ncbi:MAG: tryptophan--tRNA ligase [Candidatus Aenigmarchaeota archaeon]|nr:tryptophan--tRNA ligase [Candidatus Aenigmarchaeota archaeon]